MSMYIDIPKLYYLNRVVKDFFMIRYCVKNRPVICYWGVKNAIVFRYCLKIKSVIRYSTKISYRDPLLN